jgi:hypothetical protein
MTSKTAIASVIDDEMILDWLVSELKENEKEKGVGNIVDIAPRTETLKLSFKNIRCIENLVGFDNLVTLCLDNNQLTEIRGIGHLVNLRWLDLSFNKISKIQGLECLSKLEDLSLANNRIREVEGIDHCKHLKCLSLGDNKLDSLEQINKLRPLKKLSMLTLASNPIAREVDYRVTVLAFISQLRYLDYALVSAADISAAREQFHDELVDLEEKEQVDEEQQVREEALEVYRAELSSARILYAHDLVEQILGSDEDMDRLRHIPGIKDICDTFRAAYTTMSDEYIKVRMGKFKQHRGEENDFVTAIMSVRVADEDESRTLTRTYTAKREAAVFGGSELAGNSVDFGSELSGSMVADGALATELRADLDTLIDALMSIELRQQDKFDLLMNAFEDSLITQKAQALDFQQVFFKDLEEMNQKLTDNIKACCLDVMDRLAREELPEDYLDDEALTLSMDKDICLSLVGNVHDKHISIILKGDDVARRLETEAFSQNLAKHITKEKTRSRNRVLQIHDFKKNALASIELALETDEEGY